MERISKPHIVDLLRIFDRRKWLIPRIRYASVRSKPDLIRDLNKFFFTYIRENKIFITKRDLEQVARVPSISYDLKTRKFAFDGKVMDIPAESRKAISFSISHNPVTVRFDEFR